MEALSSLSHRTATNPPIAPPLQISALLHGVATAPPPGLAAATQSSPPRLPGRRWRRRGPHQRPPRRPAAPGPLRSACDAARTSVLSSRWSDLWRRLPELYFSYVPPSALEAALAKVAVPKLSVLNISFYQGSRGDDVSSAAVASLLRTAARLDPVDLYFFVSVDENHRDEIIELPCFARATKIHLSVDLHLTLPAHRCEFPVLERLYISWCHIDTGALISRCPHLRVLHTFHCQNNDTLMVHSNTIEELDVSHFGGCIDIVAPELKKLRLYASMHKDFCLSLSTPMVQDQSWRCTLDKALLNLGIDGSWCLSRLELATKEIGSVVIRLNIRRPKADSILHSRNLSEMFQFPKFSVLELYLATSGHVYGALLLKLLRICNGIRRLKLVTNQNVGNNDETCTPNCPCDRPRNWRSQNIFLIDLEELEIENFKGRGHELDFLKLMFRCAPLTKVTVKLESKVSPSSKGCKETYNLFKANPAVECNVYQKRGKEVIYA
ncbi:hypothetical protein EJB05_11160, partial [Eragrostis curvula]